MPLKNDHSEKQNVIPFMNDFSDNAPSNLDDIMEWLDDNGYLSDKGKIFKSRFWELFIKNGIK